MNRRVLLVGFCGFLLSVALPVFAALLATPTRTLAQAGTPIRPTRSMPTDQIIVKYKTSARLGTLDFIPNSPRLRMLNLVAGVTTNYLRAMTANTHVFKLAGRLTVTEVQTIADRMLALPEIEYAEPDRILQPQAIPNDPRWTDQWQYWDAYGMNLPSAWDITTGVTNTVVAVIDTGYRPHADLAGRFIQGYDFIGDVLVANDGDGRDANAQDPGDWITSAESASGYFTGCPVSNSSWHGTHVAGTIGANSNNGLGVSGINWRARILPVRVLGKCGGYDSDIIDGMRWAAGLSVPLVPNNANPAKVMNLSLGGSGACSAAWQSAIYEINAAGAIIVVAAGNNNDNASGYNPANCNGVISVGATGKTGVRAYYSNYGASVDVSAPGGAQSYANDPNGILSTLNTGTTVPAADTYVYYQGTSMATPHVVGLVSLMLTLSPTLNYTRTEAILKATTRPFGPGNNCATLGCGTGIIDAFAALSATLPMTVSNSGPTVLGQTTRLTATINGSGLAYAWRYGDGTADTGATVSHVFPLSGTFTAVVTATNGTYTRTASTLVMITNQAPVPNAGANQSVTVNSLVTLNGSASTDPDGHLPLTYGWRQTGGTPVSLSGAVLSKTTFTAPGSPAVLTFTLTVTDARGLVSATSARTVITVSDTPIISIVATNNSPTTLGQTTTLTATANGSNVIYAWRFGDGSIGSGATVSHTYPLSGTYMAIVTATNGTNSQSSTTSVTITNLAPVAVAGTNQSVSVNTPVTLDGLGSYDPDGHTPLTYGWQQTGGTAVVLSSDVISRATFTAPGAPSVLTFTLTVTDARGLATAAPASVVVTVSDVPISNLSAANSSPTTLGQFTYLTATLTGSNVVYTWVLGDGTFGSGANVSHVYPLSGTYSVIVTATNSENSQSATTLVTITNQAPVAVVAPAQDVHVNAVVTLDGSASYDPDGHTPLTYGWMQTGGPVVALSNAEISRTMFTTTASLDVLTFTLVVTDARGLVTAMPAHTIVTVSDTLISGIIVTNSSPTTLDGTTLFTVTAVGNILTYTWSFGDGNVATGASVSHIYLLSGTYTAVVTASNGTSSLSAVSAVTITNQAPVAVAVHGENQNVIINTLVTLDGSGSYDPDGHVPLTYRWHQIGEPAVSLSNPTISRTTFTAPATPAVLTFTLTVTDARGLVTAAPASVVVTVSDIPISNLKTANSSPTTLGQTTTFTATADGSNVVYTWAFGDGSTASGATVSYVYPLSSTYMAVVTATNGSGSLTMTMPVTITNFAPVAVAGFAQNVFVNALVTLDGSGSTDPDGHTPLTYGWQQTGGTAVTLNDATISRTTFTAPSTPAVLTFTLTVTDARGLVTAAPASVVITISDIAISNLNAANSSPTTLGQITYLTATALGSNVVYTWDFSDGSTGSGTNTSHIYALSGAYTAIVTATNGANSQSATTAVTITNQPPVAVASANQSVGVSTLVTLDGSGSVDPDRHLPLGYDWQQTGGMPVVLSSRVISRPTFTAPATPAVLTFTLTVTDARGLLTASPATTVVTVNIIAISNLNAINSGPTTSGQTTYLTATADGSNIGYTWDFGDGSTNSGATVSHNYAQPGLYSAMVTATNGAGSITATTTVSITPIVVSCTPLSYITVTGSITGMIDTLQPFTATVAPLTATLPMTVTWQAAGQQTVVTQTTLYTSFISYAWPVIGQRVITATAANGCSEVNATMVIAIQREYRFYMPMILR